MRGRTKGYVGFTALGLTALGAWQGHAWAGNVTDFPDGNTEPMHAGHWAVRWMKPEPMHAIESVENNRKPGEPPFLRVEIKVGK